MKFAPPPAAAIVPAAGHGKRLGGKTPKPFVLVEGKPLFIHTLVNLKRAFSFQNITIPVEPRYVKKAERWVRELRIGKVRVIPGGRTRAESVRKGLLAVSAGCDWVLIHDAARPLVTRAVVQKLFREASKTGAAICAEPVSSTVKRIDPSQGVVIRTEDRNELFLAQTPQLFRRDLLLRRYQTLGKKAMFVTDEAALFDGSGVQIKLVQGDRRNIKVTTKEDLKLLRFYMGQMH